MKASELYDKQKKEITEGKRHHINFLEIRFELYKEGERLSKIKSLLERQSGNQDEIDKLKLDLRLLALEVRKVDKILF